MGEIFDIVQWVFTAIIIPTVAWLFQRQLRQLRTKKEVHDTYEQMYEKVSESLLELQDENKKMFDAIQRLERAISRASVCRFYDNCPVVHELRGDKNIDDENGIDKPRKAGQRKRHNRKTDKGDPDPCVAGGTDPVT
jgi:hypothetical protein